MFARTGLPECIAGSRQNLFCLPVRASEENLFRPSSDKAPYQKRDGAEGEKVLGAASGRCVIGPFTMCASWVITELTRALNQSPVGAG